VDPNHAIGGVLAGFVLPDAQNRPSEIGQPSIGVAIPFLVLPYLPLPPIRIRLRPSAMLGTTVPETPIDEDGEADTWE
jgi:hypothetical protein